MKKQQSALLMNMAAKASIAVAAILVVAKLVAWVMTDSVALLGSLVDSGLDLATSFINFLAVKMALEPADKEHRFGHGKAEAIAGLFQGAVIFGSAAFLALESVKRLAVPEPVTNSQIGIGVSILAIILTLALVIFQKAVVNRTGSVAISADSLHYTGDLLMNAAVIAAFIITHLSGYWWVDSIFGISIALYIGRAAYQVGRTSFDMLMDREFSKEDREKIFNLVLGNPDVMGLHDLRTRKSGTDSFIQMHIELQPDLPLRKAHMIGDEIEATVGEAFPGAEIFIHKDPLGVEEPHDIIKELE